MALWLVQVAESATRLPLTDAGRPMIRRRRGGSCLQHLTAVRADACPPAARRWARRRAAAGIDGLSLAERVAHRSGGRAGDCLGRAVPALAWDDLADASESVRCARFGRTAQESAG